MKEERNEYTKNRILSLIEAEFESDVAFERAMGIPDKTVNNWRRGRSSSFMRMLPEIAARFRVTVSDLLNVPIGSDTSELSEEEKHLVHLYRRSRTLPEAQRAALRKTLESVVLMYLELAGERGTTRRKRVGKV
ncbi:MAG: hypothetical protein IJY65_01705 [Clostridia bacterium]|nr:hypothetical protein [Clostridia bacterium]